MTFGANGSNILAFLTQQIKEGEDVEIGLFAHMMTLVGVGTDTTTNMPAIEYIDPNAPATDSWSALSFVGSDGQYAITITGSGYGPPTTFDDKGNPTAFSDTSEIYYAFAESPAPRPFVLWQ